MQVIWQNHPLVLYCRWTGFDVNCCWLSCPWIKSFFYRWASNVVCSGCLWTASSWALSEKPEWLIPQKASGSLNCLGQQWCYQSLTHKVVFTPYIIRPQGGLAQSGPLCNPIICVWCVSRRPHGVGLWQWCYQGEADTCLLFLPNNYLDGPLPHVGLP